MCWSLIFSTFVAAGSSQSSNRAEAHSRRGNPERINLVRSDADAWSVTVKLGSVSERIAEVVLEVEGQSRTYRNEPERWLTITWPGKGAHGAKLRVRGVHMKILAV